MLKIKELPFEFYKIYKIYEFYDEPIIYSFIDTNGKYYLVNWIDWIEETDENVWMYLSVNKEDLSQLENKAYSLREFLDKNLSRNVYVAIEDGEKEEFFLTKIKEFKDSWLPAADYYIEDMNKKNVKNKNEKKLKNISIDGTLKAKRSRTFSFSTQNESTIIEQYASSCIMEKWVSNEKNKVFKIKDNVISDVELEMIDIKLNNYRSLNDYNKITDYKKRKISYSLMNGASKDESVSVNTHLLIQT